MTIVRLPRLRPGTFASLSTPNYRLFFFGQIVSQSGTWMQTVAQSFLVLDLSNSGTVLGLTTAARFAPLFVLGPWGGLIADRMDKRRVLFATQSLSGLLALAFGLLISFHAISIPLVYVLALALGLVNVLDNPARQAILSELVPRTHLLNAVTLSSVTMNAARVFGAAFGGAAAAGLGLAACFDLNAASFLAALLALWLISPAAMRKSVPEPREAGQVRAGLRYVRRTPELLIPMLMIAIIGTFAWEFQISLPLLAKDTFGGDTGTYAIMSVAMGIGAVAGGLVSASRTRVPTRILAVTSIWWSVSIIATALAPTRLVSYVVLVFVGFGTVSFNATAKTVLQLAAVPAMRGRVMALWALAWQGSTPIGGPIIGWISEQLSPRWGLLAGGLPTLAVGLIAYPLLTRVDHRALAPTTAEASSALIPNPDPAVEAG